MKRFAALLIILMLLFTSSAQAMWMIHHMEGFNCAFPKSAEVEYSNKEAGKSYVYAYWFPDSDDGAMIAESFIWWGKKFNMTVKEAKRLQKKEKDRFMASRKKNGEKVDFYYTPEPYKTKLFEQDCIISATECSYREGSTDRHNTLYRIYFGAKGYEIVLMSNSKDALEKLFDSNNFQHSVTWAD